MMKLYLNTRGEVLLVHITLGVLAIFLYLCRVYDMVVCWPYVGIMTL